MALLFLVKGKNSVVSVSDNLDSVIPRFRLMKSEELFFTQDEYAGFQGGTERDLLPSEAKLYTLLYAAFPAIFAYFFGKLLSILLSTAGAFLFVREKYGKGGRFDAFGILFGFGFGLLPVPAESAFWFASLPLLCFLLLKIRKKPHFVWFLLLFFYPVLSDLLHFGFFILAGVLIYFIAVWIREKKFPLRILLSFFLIVAGYALSEYRLMRQLFFEDNEYLWRMASADHAGGRIFRFLSEHLPAAFDIRAGVLRRYPLLLIAAAVLLLAGFFLVRSYKDLYDPETGVPRPDRQKKGNLLRGVVNGCLLFYMAFNLFLNFPENDFLHTLFPATAGKERTTWRAYYSEGIFEKIREDLDYEEEWTVAYGIDPGVLNYNGLVTLDGYFDRYSINYRDYFRRVIAPAIEGQEFEAEIDRYGAELRIPAPGDPETEKTELKIDLNALKYLGGRYLISAYEIGNAKEIGLDEAGVYTEEGSPCRIRVYKMHSRYPEKTISDIPFSERSEDDYDTERMHELEAEIGKMSKEAKDYAEKNGIDFKKDEEFILMKDVLDMAGMEELYDSLEQEMMKLRSCYSILNIRYNRDVKNEELAKKEQELHETAVDEGDLYARTLRDICTSPYYMMIRRKLSYGAAESLAEYEDMTEEEKERSAKINSLEQEYDKAALEDQPFEYKGESWTYDLLSERAEELDQDTYIEIYIGIGKERAKVLGEIYVQLLKLYHENALEEDYDSYADYAYEKAYSRDYDVKEAKEMLKDLRKKGSGYITRIGEIGDATESDFGVITPDDTETWNLLLPYMEDIDPELGISLRHLIDCGLYDMNYSETKVANTGYTTPLNYYGDAFIFDEPMQTSDDLFTYVHEFGHYNNDYHSDESLLMSFNNLDVAEIHSQGLEMLFTKYYPEIYGDEMGKALEVREVSSMVTKLPEIAIVAEFEIYAHEHPESTVEELSRKFYDLMKDYGYYYPPGVDAIYTWVEIPHIFNTPNYYIAYLTSALTSVEIYTLSHEDREKAIDKYMDLTSFPSAIPYSGAVESVGLGDIFDKGTAREILKKTYRILQYGD